MPEAWWTFRRPGWFVAAVVGVGWWWLFADPLSGKSVCAFRDAGNFYYPLFQWQASEWGAGRIPLWNPYEGLGVAALADATSSTLYPGKLIFALPGSFAWRFNLYLAVHVLLAAWSLYAVARRWRASEWGAGIGAVGYAFGGIVLFQHCNVPYLVSAAWLPWAWWFAERSLTRRDVGAAVKFGGVLALMTLGGDPQTAYHCGLLAVLSAGLLWWREWRATAASAIPWKLWQWRPCLLMISALTAFSLAAVQVWPTWEWTRRSERERFDRPRSVYEWAGLAGIPRDPQRARDAKSLLQWPEREGHMSRVYRYSVGPWRWPELLIPNYGGRPFPTHSRWLAALPAEGDYWTPTLYGGVLTGGATLWWCARRWKSRRGRHRRRHLLNCRETYLFLALLLGLGGALGWYGIGWVWHAVGNQDIGGAETGTIGPPVGGLYWLLVTCLPGYVLFRYPAKWLVFAACAMALLAARELDLRRRAPRPTGRWLGAVGLVGTAAILALLLGREPFQAALRGVASHQIYGPFDADAAWFGLIGSIAQVMLVVIAACSIRLGLFRGQREYLGPVWMLVATIDVVVANHGCVATVPTPVLEARSRAAETYRAAFASVRPAELPRIEHGGKVAWVAAEWQEKADPNRLAQVVTYERDRMLGLHPLLERVPMRDARGTLELPPASIPADSPAVPVKNLGPGVALDRSMDWVWQSARPRVWFRPHHAAATWRLTANSDRPTSYHVELTTPVAGTLVLDELADSSWLLRATELESGQLVAGVREVAGDGQRKILLPPGSYRLEWTYRPFTFWGGLAISLASALCLGVGWAHRRGSLRKPTLVRGANQDDRAGKNG